MKYLLFVGLVLLGSCAEREPSPPAATRVAEPTDVINRDLMVALSQAKNLHHKAKIYMADGNLATAISAVREILSLRFPANAPEAEDVRNDARALLAKLLLGQGQAEEAMTVVQEGLAASQRDSFFVANLYTVKGEVHEARAAALDAAGDPASKTKSTDEKHAAIESYDKSIQIDKELQKRLSEDK